MLVLLAIAQVFPAFAEDFTVGTPQEVAGLELDVGGAQVRFADARVSPIHDAGGGLAGVAVEGDGELVYPFRHRGAAQAIANRNVLSFDGRVEDWTGLAHLAEPLRTRTDRALVFLAAADAAAIVGDRDPTEAAAPTGWVEDRLSLVGQCFDLAQTVRSQPGYSLLDAGIGARLGVVSSDRGDGKRWLTVDRDPTAYPDGWRAYATGWEGGDAARCVAVDSGPAVAPPAPTLLGRSVDVDVRLEARPGGATVDLTATARWRFSNEVVLPALTLDLPPDAAITGVLLDGFDVEVTGGRAAEIAAIIAPGEHQLVVDSTATWRLPRAADYNRATTSLAFVPAPRSRTTWDGRLVTRAKGIDVAQVGSTVERVVDDGETRTVSTFRGFITPHLRMAVGSWRERSEPAIEGLPAITSRVFWDEVQSLDGWGPLARTVVAYYHQILPPIGVGELEIYQTGTVVRDFARFSSLPGLIRLQQARAEGTARPHATELTFAHEIAHQWWGGRVVPATSGDLWMMETLAEVYACLFGAAAYGARRCDRTLRRWQREWEARNRRGPDPALSQAASSPRWTEAAYRDGPVLFGRVLKAEVGGDALLAGLGALAAAHDPSHPVTTRDLEQALSLASKRDLGPWFDTWVHGGILPAVTLHVGASSSQIYVDVPFGTYEVPVQITDAEGTRVVWVKVVDGVGNVDHPGATKVRLDPERLMPARSRSTRR